MPLPTSSAGLFMDAINVRPLRITLDGEALGGGFTVKGCVACGSTCADGKMTLKVPTELPSVWAALAAFVGTTLVLFGSGAVFLALSAVLRRSLGLPERVALGIGAVLGLLTFAAVVGGAAYLLRSTHAQIELGRCRSCRGDALAGALRMAAVVLLLVFAPMVAAAGTVKGLHLTDGAALVIMLSGTATSVVLCVLLHPHVWQHLVFTVHVECVQPGIRLVGGPKLAEVIAAERPDVIAQVQVLGKLSWRKAPRGGLSLRAPAAASSSHPAATTR